LSIITKPGDPGFVQFVEAWVAQMIVVMPLPNAVTADDAEGSLVDVLKALCATPGPKINPLEVLKTSDPMEWLTELRRVATTKPAAEDSFDNLDLNKAITVLRSHGFYTDKGIVVKFSQLNLISKATAVKEDCLSAPNLCVDPRVQPVSLRAMLDVHGNFAPDQTKMVQQADGSYVEATTPDPVSKKARSAMEVARGHSMYWVAHLVTSIRHTTLHSKYASRTTSTTGLWLHPYYVAKCQTVLWRVVDRVSGDTLDGILTQLQYVQERTNTADEDAWTGEAAVEYVCAKLSEQVSFAAAMTGKRKADAPQGGKPQKSSTGTPVTCTVCKKNKTIHASKVCLACAQAKKAASAPAAAAAAPAAAAAAPAAGP
jgi:hypothetical protein